jgi:serine/threonine-protein kinase HipA
MELTVHYAPEGLAAARAVGRLYEDSRGAVYFEYDKAWRADGLELSPLHLPRSLTGAVAGPARTYGPLFGLFDDALPDWWGEQMMRRFFGDLGIPWNRVTALQKLACGGESKMGALVFRPAFVQPSFRHDLTVEVGQLVEAAQAAAHGETGPLLDRLIPSALTPGGAQPKAALSFSADFARLGPTEPPDDDFTAWLLKFDLDPELHEGRIELAFNRMAAAAGIEVAGSRLLESRDGRRAHFMSRRFDRGPGGRRVHMHTFSGLTHTPPRDGVDYHDLLNLTRQLARDQAAVEQVFRRAAFNIAAGNDDDHGRNHAFLLEPDGTWRLSPAYDLTLAANPLTSGIRAGAVNGKTHDIGRRDLLRLADDHGVRRPGEALDQVTDALARWPGLATAAGIPPAVAAACRKRMPGLG